MLSLWIIAIAVALPQEIFQVVRQARIKRPDNRHLPIEEGTKGYGCWFHTSDKSGMWILPRKTKKITHKKLTSLYNVPYTTQEMIHIRSAKLEKFDSILFQWNFNYKRSEIVVFHDGNCSDIPVYRVARCNSSYIDNNLVCS